MNYNFTDRVRKVLAMAREEAIRLQHDYVGTEHILLGLKLLPGLRVYTLNQIMIFTQSAHLEKLAGATLSPGEADTYRASYIRNLLKRDGMGDIDEATT